MSSIFGKYPKTLFAAAAVTSASVPALARLTPLSDVPFSWYYFPFVAMDAKGNFDVAWQDPTDA